MLLLRKHKRRGTLLHTRGWLPVARGGQTGRNQQERKSVCRIFPFHFPPDLFPIYFRCSSFTLAVTGFPSRSTVTGTTSPTLLRRSASVKSYKFLIGLSPNWISTSPAWNPAFAAGDPGLTSENRTPFSVCPKSGIEPK